VVAASLIPLAEDKRPRFVDKRPRFVKARGMGRGCFLRTHDGYSTHMRRQLALTIVSPEIASWESVGGDECDGIRGSGP
jgi:hypothetical protein